MWFILFFMVACAAINSTCADPYWSQLSKIQIGQFKRAKVDGTICEIVQAVPGTRVISNNTFPCGLDTCLQWCMSDSSCSVAIFQPGKCSIIAQAQTTDTISIFYKLYQSSIQVYQKYPQFKLPYYSQMCVEYPKSSCRGKCAWKRGKSGYNRPIYGGFEGAWCGRVKC